MHGFGAAAHAPQLLLHVQRAMSRRIVASEESGQRTRSTDRHDRTILDGGQNDPVAFFSCIWSSLSSKRFHQFTAQCQSKKS
jgi:hypothetical protein